MTTISRSTIDPYKATAYGCSQTYKGTQIFNEKEKLLIENNMSLYQGAEEKSNIPWQVFAAIHSQESNFSDVNPDNGQGIFQLYTTMETTGKTWEPGKQLSREDMEEQIDSLIAELEPLKKGIDLSTDAGVKELFFKYNSRADYYINQGYTLGFSKSEVRDGEGSPYVTNLSDSDRDSTRNSNRKQYKYDNSPVMGPAGQRPGAWLKFVALGGSQTATCNGGLNLEEAENLMASYRQKAQDHLNDKGKIALSSERGSSESFSIDGVDCKEGTLANCVSFVKYFLNGYTSGIKIPRYLGDGKYVVGTLSSNGFAIGKTPRPYAVFSKQGGRYGHTGIVLGVDIKNDKIIIGEANCGLGINGIRVLEEKLSDYMKGYTYAYTDLYVKGL